MHERGSYERSLTDALWALAEEDARAGASANVEARLLVEVRSLSRARRRTHMKLCAIAAVLVMSVSVPLWQLAERWPAAAPAPAAADLSVDAVTEFFPLTFSDVPVTRGQLVRLEVPWTALASFGLQLADSPGARPATVLADVLVGEDGLARAVRFVRLGSTQAPQELPQ
jgi:hypothetical protein